MQYIDNSHLVFDFYQQRGGYERELRRTKRQIYNQYILEARRGGVSEKKVKAVFNRCFTSYINILTKKVLPRQPQVSLIELAKDRTEILTQLIRSTPSIGRTPSNHKRKREAVDHSSSQSEDEMSVIESDNMSTNGPLYREWKRNLKIQKKLRLEIKDAQDELEEHKIHVQLTNSEGVVVEVLKEGRGVAPKPVRKKRRRKFDPSDLQQLERRVESQRKHIKQRELLLKSLKSEVEKYESRLDLSSLRDDEWTQREEDMSLVNVEELWPRELEEASNMMVMESPEEESSLFRNFEDFSMQAKEESRNQEIENWVGVFLSKFNSNLLFEANQIFQMIPASLRKDFCRRFGIEWQNNTATVDCRGCTSEGGWNNLLVCFTVLDVSKITIKTDNDEIKKTLVEILNKNFRREWLVVVPRTQHIFMSKRTQGSAGGIS